MTTPPAANAPMMPITRPRTTGVVTAYLQPSTITRRALLSPSTDAGPEGMCFSREITTPETMNETALK